MPKPFRLADLPFVTQSEVLLMLDPVQVFELSLISFPIKQTVSLMKPLVAENVFWQIPQLFRQFPGFLVKVSLSKENTFIFKPKECIGQFSRKVINNQMVPVKRTKNVFEIECRKNAEETMKMFEAVVQHCIGVFKHQNFHFNSAMFLLDNPIFRLPKNYASIKLVCQDLSLNQINFIFDSVPTNRLILEKTNVRAFKGPMTVDLKIPEIEIGSGEWLSFDSLLNMRTKKMTIESIMPGVTLKDLEKFVKTWVNGGLNSLESFSLKFYNRFHEKERRTMFRDDLRENLKAAGVRLTAESNGSLIKITRKDGKRAQITFYEFFKFTVIKKKNQRD